MSSVNQFKGEIRENTGKGASREARRSDRIPAVLYGGESDPVHFTVEPVALSKELHATGFFSKIYDLDLGKGKEKALPRDVQFHPVTDVPIHLDFVRVTKGTNIHVAIPITFINEILSPGMKKGGVLNISVHALDATCDVYNMPEEIIVDLEGLEIHGTIHLADLKLPEGVVPLHPERDDVIANVVAPTIMKETDEDEGEAAEGEETTEEGSSEASSE